MSHAKQVLVIDDNADICEAVCDLLGFSKIAALSATDGITGLQLFQQHHPNIDAVMLDLQMPGMDGAETYRHLRSIDPVLPVIITSGGGKSTMPSIFGHDANIHFLYKPYSFDEMVAKVEEIIATR